MEQMAKDNQDSVSLNDLLLRVQTLEKDLSAAEAQLGVLENEIVNLANQTTKEGLQLSGYAQAKLKNFLDQHMGGSVDPNPPISE